MFRGEYSHSIDTKGRLIVPIKFREQLGEHFVVTKGLDGCLFIYSDEEWNNMERKFRELPVTTQDGRRFTRFFFAGAADCEVDKQGRVLIPGNLREYAGLKKEVILIGVFSRIEIWDKEKWNKESEYGDMNEIAEGMFDKGFDI